MLDKVKCADEALMLMREEEKSTLLLENNGCFGGQNQCPYLESRRKKRKLE